jgi:uncharacterized membrane protein YeiH
LLVVLVHAGTDRSLALLIAAATVIAVRLLAIRFNWALPRAQD